LLIAIVLLVFSLIEGGMTISQGFTDAETAPKVIIISAFVLSTLAIIYLTCNLTKFFCKKKAELCF